MADQQWKEDLEELYRERIEDMMVDITNAEVTLGRLFNEAYGAGFRRTHLSTWSGLPNGRVDALRLLASGVDRAQRKDTGEDKETEEAIKRLEAGMA